MPRPRLAECAHCGRMFTVHSIALHAERCLDAPNGREFRPGVRPAAAKGGGSDGECDDNGPASHESSRSNSKSDRRHHKHRSKHHSYSPGEQHRAAKGAEGGATHRPYTVTISGGQSDPSLAGQAARLRVCYVCGRRYAERALPHHESQCRAKWKEARRHLPKSIAAGGEPTKFDVPSVDGTVDGNRMNAWAAQSAEAAQACRCRVCNRRMPLHDGREHAAVCRRGGGRTLGEVVQSSFMPFYE